jgi:hypothetical protein
MASLAALFMVAPNVSAEDVSYEVLLERIESLESQLSEQDTRFASYNLGGSEQKDDDCGSCQKGKGDCDCRPTWTFMVEVPWLQVHDGGLVIPGFVNTPQYGQELSLRLIAAREWDNGLGFRFTGFHFDDTAGNGLIGPVGLASQTEVYAIDFELTQRAQFCGWDLMATGGVRIGGFDQALNVIVGADTLELAREFDGAGLTGGIEFNRGIGQTRLNAYGGLNFSLLFGDADVNVAATGAAPIAATVASLPNQTVAVWEMQLGVEYKRETRFGMGLARVGVEAQMWEQPPVLLGLGDDNVGFFGPTFALGLER